MFGSASGKREILKFGKHTDMPDICSDSLLGQLHKNCVFFGKYMAHFGKKMGNVNLYGYFVFQGDVSTRCEPPVVHLMVAMLQVFTARVRTEQEIQEHYT